MRGSKRYTRFMANIKSAIKRARQNAKRNALKSSQRASTRTAVKAVDNAIEAKDKNLALEQYILRKYQTTQAGDFSAPLNTGYEPPHMSYSIQWLFFALCLSIVILRKNKLL